MTDRQLRLAPQHYGAAMTYCNTCNQQTVESVSSRRYSLEDLHDAEQRAYMLGCAEGKKDATERIAEFAEQEADRFERRGDDYGTLAAVALDGFAHALQLGQHEGESQ